MKKTISLVLAVLCCLCCLGSFASCGDKKDEKTVTVAASSTPHALILEQCKEEMAKKGYNLVIKVMDDYITPNTATEDGEVDANYFQHTPYLREFNEENKTHLVSILKVHYEPYGIYAGTVNSLDAIPEGAKIAVPNDPTNEARALLLLEANGILTLKEGAGLSATKNDIVSNPKNVQILEMEAALIPGVRSEVAVAVINGNYAMQNNLKVSEALAVEDGSSEAAQTFANILVVKEGNENLDKIKALVEVLSDAKIAEYIKNTFDGSVVALN